jgi:hypothetical protein
VDFSIIFGAGFSGRTFDESAAKIEGGHDSWLAEVVVEGRRRVGGEGEGRRRVVVGGRR